MNLEKRYLSFSIHGNDESIKCLQHKMRELLVGEEGRLPLLLDFIDAGLDGRLVVLLQERDRTSAIELTTFVGQIH